MFDQNKIIDKLYFKILKNFRISFWSKFLIFSDLESENIQIFWNFRI